MAKRDSFLMRVDPLILEAIRRWSEDELRSMNAQIEFLLRNKLKEAGRLPQKSSAQGTSESQPESQAKSLNPANHPPNDDGE